jgi:hypothetical protein
VSGFKTEERRTQEGTRERNEQSTKSQWLFPNKTLVKPTPTTRTQNHHFIVPVVDQSGFVVQDLLHVRHHQHIHRFVFAVQRVGDHFHRDVTQFGRLSFERIKTRVVVDRSGHCIEK